MNDYEKLKSLNDLAEKMFSGIDEYSDHLLYKDDTYLKMWKQMKELKDKVVKSLGDGKNKDIEKEINRVDKFNELFYYIADMKGAVDNLGNSDSYEEDAKFNKKVYNKMIRFKLIMADIRSRLKDNDFSGAIDPEKMNSLSKMDNISSVLQYDDHYMRVMENMVADPNDRIRNAAKQAMKNGTLQQHVQITPVSGVDASDPKKYTSMVTGRTGAEVETVRRIINTDRVKEVIKQYNNAQKYWLSSSLTDQEEKNSRRAFMECYEDELNGLYQALNCDSAYDAPGARNSVLGVLRDNGLESMMRDYVEMISDRKYEKGESHTEDASRAYLYDGMTDEEMDFRSIRTESKLYSDAALENKTQLLGLKEFHKWIYRNCDEVGLGVAFGANGSARGYMEDFMKASYKDQIMTLYMLENKSRKAGSLPTDEQLKEYVPNIKKLKDVMVSSKFKIWQRLNGKKHRWNKIKECMDRIKNGVGQGKPAKGGLNLDNTVDAITKTTRIGTTITDAIDKANVPSKAIGGISDALFAIKSVAGLAGNLAKLKDIKKLDGLEKGKLATDIGVSGANATAFVSKSIDFGIRVYEGKLVDNTFTTAFGNLSKNMLTPIAAAGLGLNIYGAGTTLARNRIFGKTNDAILKKVKYDDMDNDDPRKEVFRKIKKHGHALKGINHRKMITNIFNGGNGIVAVTGGLFGAAGVTSVAAVTGIAGAVAVPGLLALNNWRERRANRAVVDAELYENEAQKTEAIREAKAGIEKKLKRIPNSPMYSDLRKELNRVKKSEKSLLNRIRINIARKNNCVNEKQLRNQMVQNIGKDIYEMYQESNKEDSKYQGRGMKEIVGLAAKNLKRLANGKNPDLNKENLDEKGIKELDAKNVQNIIKGI